MENRPIKFRAWKEETKQMFFSEGFTGAFFLFDGDDDLKIHPGVPVMQFTGLLDKNGKEIYEGDIVQYEHQWRILTWKGMDEGKKWEDIPEEWATKRSAVQFDHGGFTLEYPLRFPNVVGVGGPPEDRKMGYLADYSKKDDRGHGDAREEWRNFEIIGNIYENPELLKV